MDLACRVLAQLADTDVHERELLVDHLDAVQCMEDGEYVPTSDDFDDPRGAAKGGNKATSGGGRRKGAGGGRKALLEDAGRKRTRSASPSPSPTYSTANSDSDSDTSTASLSPPPKKSAADKAARKAAKAGRKFEAQAAKLAAKGAAKEAAKRAAPQDSDDIPLLRRKPVSVGGSGKASAEVPNVGRASGRKTKEEVAADRAALEKSVAAAAKKQLEDDDDMPILFKPAAAAPAAAAAGKKKKAADYPQDAQRWMEPQVQWGILPGFNPPNHRFPFATRTLSDSLLAVLDQVRADSGPATAEKSAQLMRKVLMYYRFRVYINSKRKWDGACPSLDQVLDLVNDKAFRTSTTCWDEHDWWVSREEVRDPNRVRFRDRTPSTPSSSDVSSDDSSELPAPTSNRLPE